MGIWIVGGIVFSSWGEALHCSLEMYFLCIHVLLY